MRVCRVVVVVGLVSGACGGSGAPPGNHILDEGHGEPNRAPLQPLRPGTQFIADSASSEIVEAPVTDRGLRLIRVRSFNKYGVIGVAELRFDDHKNLLLVGNNVNGRLDRPMMTVPGTVRDGMKWEADPDGEGGADYHFEVADLGQVEDAAFGPQHEWTITITEYASGTQSVRTYAEGFGLVRVGDGLPPRGVFPLDDGPALDAPDLGPTIPLTFVGDDADGFSAATYATGSFITLGNGTTMAAIRDAEGTIGGFFMGGCVALPAMQRSLSPITVTLVSPPGGVPTATGWNAITGAGECPMTDFADLPAQGTGTTTMASAAGAYVHGNSVYWFPAAHDIDDGLTNSFLGLSRSGTVGDGTGHAAATMTVLGVNAAGDADTLVFGRDNLSPILVRGSNTQLYATTPQLATRVADPWRSLRAPVLTFRDPGSATHDATLVFNALDGSVHVARIEDGVGRPAVRQPVRLPGPSLHASDGGGLDALQIDPDGVVQEWVVDGSGLTLRSLGRLEIPAGHAALNGYRQGNDVFVFTLSYDATAGGIGPLHLYRGSLPAAPGATVSPIPAGAISSYPLGIDGEGVAICWPGSGTLSAADVTLDGVAPGRVINYDNGGPCAVIVRDLADDLNGGSPLVVANLPGIGRVALNGGAAAPTGTPIEVPGPLAWLPGQRSASRYGISDPTGTIVEAPEVTTGDVFNIQSTAADLGGAGLWWWRTIFEDGMPVNELVLIGDPELRIRDPQLGDPGQLIAIAGGDVLVIPAGGGPGAWHRVDAAGTITTFPALSLQSKTLLAVLADGTLIGHVAIPNGPGSDSEWFAARDGQILKQVPAVRDDSGLMPDVALHLPDGALALTSSQYGLPVTRLDVDALTTTEVHAETLHLRNAPDGTIWGWERGWSALDPPTTFGQLDANGYHPIALRPEWAGRLVEPVVGDTWVRFGSIFVARP